MAECPGKPATPCWQTGALKDCSGHGTEGACSGDVCCVWSAGPCSGASPSHDCGSYPSCGGPPCCQGNHYTGCGGTVSDPCTADDCSATCCNRGDGACGGNHIYSGPCTYGTQGACEADPCCWWSTSCQKRYCPGPDNPPGAHEVQAGACVTCGCTVDHYHCLSKKNCADIPEVSCTGCGCTKQGNCPRKACADIPSGDCASCEGCSASGTCGSKACAAMASAVCVQCTGCSCCWKIETTCEITSNATAYSLWIAANGKVTHTGGTITIEDYKRTPAVAGNSYYYRKPPGVRRVSGHGSRCCG